MQVNIADRLSGKYILLIFYGLSDHLHPPSVTDTRFISELEEIYKDRREEFEIIFIAFGDNKKAFNSSISTMPWLAIPHEDFEARDVIRTKFDLPGRPYDIHSVLFDSHGVVLHNNPMCLILAVGLKAFPFTQKKIDQVCCLYPLALWDQLVLEKKRPSLRLLLGDTLVSPLGDEACQDSLLLSRD